MQSSRLKDLLVISRSTRSIQVSFWPSKELAEVAKEDWRGKLVAELGSAPANQPSWATWDCPAMAVALAAWNDFKLLHRWRRWGIAVAAQEHLEAAQGNLPHSLQMEGIRPPGGSWWLAAWL